MRIEQNLIRSAKIIFRNTGVRKLFFAKISKNNFRSPDVIIHLVSTLRRVPSVILGNQVFFLSFLLSQE
ncbi:Uncharacterized protein dnm_006940 [Desulfonema magnum]|uniref:Uncharacterized protein n=1 Tax=Desulfonema magnum TaxID=45655 RepID=A0A975BG73_9BACT|nr:Uncharacterized protein dnm_006940 [Desulfonema magnum]